MTDLSAPPFEPDRFRSAAEFYERGRAAYAPALIRRVVDVCSLEPRHRLLDLGCGTGPLARAFSPFVGEVVAVDPSREMLAAARPLAGEARNIAFAEGSSYDLGPAFRAFRLVVMGRSFHWMDRVDTLRRLDGMIERAARSLCFMIRRPKSPPMPGAKRGAKLLNATRARSRPIAARTGFAMRMCCWVPPSHGWSGSV